MGARQMLRAGQGSPRLGRAEVQLLLMQSKNRCAQAGTGLHGSCARVGIWLCTLEEGSMQGLTTFLASCATDVLESPHVI